jgi:hypothetical protein
MNIKSGAGSLEEATKRLSRIPSIGPKVGMMLAEIGIRNISDLVGCNPESLYKEVCKRRGKALDRCVLYHFRCAVYYASNDVHQPERLKWWYWKENA